MKTLTELRELSPSFSLGYLAAIKDISDAIDEQYDLDHEVDVGLIWILKFLERNGYK